MDFYSSISEMDFEFKPSTEVLEDDKELDVYLQDLVARQRRERHKARHG